MTEQELQQYLLSKYPMENEGCEWEGIQEYEE